MVIVSHRFSKELMLITKIQDVLLVTGGYLLVILFRRATNSGHPALPNLRLDEAHLMTVALARRSPSASRISA